MLCAVGQVVAYEWRTNGRTPGPTVELLSAAGRLLGLTGDAVALAAYVTFESVRALAVGTTPDASPVGIGLAIASWS